MGKTSEIMLINETKKRSFLFTVKNLWIFLHAQMEKMGLFSHHFWDDMKSSSKQTWKTGKSTIWFHEIPMFRIVKNHQNHVSLHQLVLFNAKTLKQLAIGLFRPNFFWGRRSSQLSSKAGQVAPNFQSDENIQEKKKKKRGLFGGSTKTI